MQENGDYIHDGVQGSPGFFAELGGGAGSPLIERFTGFIGDPDAEDFR